VRFFLDGVGTSAVDPSHAFRFTVAIQKHDVYLRGSPDAYWRVLPLKLDEFGYFGYALSKKQVAALASPSAKEVCEAGRHLTAGGCSANSNPGDVLDGTCSAGSPYDAQKCLAPLWGLNGCKKLGSSYPVSDAPNAPTNADAEALWNGKTWPELKSVVTGLAKRDAPPQLAAKKFWGTCKNRHVSGLDHLCDHPPPFHLEVCLQALFLESGCSEKGSGYPKSASHPLAQQLNSLSWRDVKEKVRHIIRTDTRGGLSEGMCHEPGQDQATN